MKARITLTAVLEYDMNPEHYTSNDPQEMLKIDIENYNSESFMLVEAAEISITGEVVEGQPQAKEAGDVAAD